jgi:hypothetical protein
MMARAISGELQSSSAKVSGGTRVLKDMSTTMLCCSDSCKKGRARHLLL